MVRKKDNKIEDLGWVKGGKQRREIIVHLNNHPHTPSELARKSNYSLNHTSRILKEFRNRKIAKLLNPEAKTGRLYEITSRGKVVRDAIRKSEDKRLIE